MTIDEALRIVLAHRKDWSDGPPELQTALNRLERAEKLVRSAVIDAEPGARIECDAEVMKNAAFERLVTSLHDERLQLREDLIEARLTIDDLSEKLHRPRHELQDMAARLATVEGLVGLR